jgi:hypothetical protein
MQANRRRAKQLAVFVIAAVAALIASMLVILLAPRTPSATVAFNGYTVDANGSKRAAFTITNTGRGTLRRWDFYRTKFRHDRKDTRHHLGPDVMLHPGTSEQITMDIPSTSLPWRATFHFSDYNVLEETTYARGNRGSIHTLIWEISDAVFDSDVDINVSTEWIEPID